ncbi:MAG: enoyl-CoA hydratase-related protein [Thermodesulfobacteriota bacterium]|nr:enoyl-CoA hydratase-related protein [Thermodesulfobacteriota bacterium]
MGLENLIFEKEGGIATIIVNRPKAMNALNSDVLTELGQVVEDIRKDDGVKVVIITGSGNRAFVAGADIAGFVKMDGSALKDFGAKGKGVFNQIEGMSKPVIAALNGMALGGGLELAMACHIRVAAEGAILGLPEAGLGLIPGFAGTQRLPRIVGKAKAIEMMVTGDNISVEEALNLRLVNRVVPLGELRETCVTMAKKIMTKAPLAVRYCIEAANEGFEESFDRGCDIETEKLLAAFATEDAREGLNSFIERRKPTYKGR